MFPVRLTSRTDMFGSEGSWSRDADCVARYCDILVFGRPAEATTMSRLGLDGAKARAALKPETWEVQDVTSVLWKLTL